MCPKYTLPRRTLQLCDNYVPLPTPLSRVMAPNGRWKNITTQMISNTLKTTANFCGPDLGFESKYVYKISLHAVSSMYILCAYVDSNIIKLIG